MEIVIDRLTNKVAGLNVPATPLNIVIKAEDDIILSKTIEEVEEKYRLDEEGRQLYKINIVPVTLESGEIIETYEETTEPNSDPILEKKYVAKSVKLEDNPEVFSLEEIVNAKYKDILEASSNDYVIADIFVDENDLDLSDPQHSANTGYGILQLLPNGQAVTKLINQEAPASLFNLLEFDADPGVELYVNDIKFIENKATFTEPISSCTIKFLNTTNKPKMVRAYAIGY